MKIYTSFSIIFFITIIFTNCKENKYSLNPDIQWIKIDINQIKEEINQSEIISSIKYIPITTTDSILIGEVTDFVVSINLFFILDRKKAHSIFIIDEGGKDIMQLNKRGIGPEEYIDPRSMAIDGKNEQILVLCNKTKRIQIYSFNGNFIRTQKIDCYSSSIAKTQSDNIVHYMEFLADKNYYKESSYPNLIILDKKNKLMDAESFFDSDLKTNLPWISDKRFSNPYIDTISLNPDHSNTVYYISSNKIVP